MRFVKLLAIKRKICNNEDGEKNRLGVTTHFNMRLYVDEKNISSSTDWKAAE